MCSYYDTISIIPKEVVFIAVHNEFGDTEPTAICKALVNIDVKSMQEEYINENINQDRYEIGIEYRIVEWLEKKRYAEKFKILDIEVEDIADKLLKLKHFSKEFKVLELYLSTHEKFDFRCYN